MLVSFDTICTNGKRFALPKHKTPKGAHGIIAEVTPLAITIEIHQ